MENHVLQIVRLYEQLRKKKATSNEMAFTLGQYVKRWQCWAAAGLQNKAIIYIATSIIKALRDRIQPVAIIVGSLSIVKTAGLATFGRVGGRYK